MNPGSKYVFIPSSGDKALVKKYIKALKQVKSERFDCDLSLIAYPEYVLYLNVNGVVSSGKVRLQ